MKRLSVWAKENGLTYNTALRWFKNGKIPVPTFQSNTGSLFVIEEEKDAANEMLLVIKEILKELKKANETR